MTGVMELGGQTLAAFCAAPRQNLAATDGGHAGTKAVPTFANNDAGLKGAFHETTPLSAAGAGRIKIKNTGGCIGF